MNLAQKKLISQNRQTKSLQYIDLGWLINKEAISSKNKNRFMKTENKKIKTGRHKKGFPGKEPAC